MKRHLFYSFLWVCVCAISLQAGAQESALRSIQEGIVTHGAQKTMLVVEFGAGAPTGSKLSDAIQQAKRQFRQVESLLFPDERALGKFLEGKTDTNIGMVVLIRPQDAQAVSTLPGLYPDIAFTTIDMVQPVFAANVQSVQFKEEDGAFLLGAIAAIASTDRITIMALGDDDRSKRMADAFEGGARHIRPNATISTLMNIRPSASQRTRLSSSVITAFREGTGILFSMDDEIVEQALRAAKPERKLVVAGNAPGPNADITRLMTYMVKRYDLALLDVLHIYDHKQWHSGVISLGVSGGYVDYSLNADNVDNFPKDSIDRIEAIKDHIGQGMIR
jgi:basic membrane lipoprotein Med (substrate-binding protein (PBP1-ABC) superfamily)